MTGNIHAYLAVIAGMTFAIRVLPLTLIRRQITNRFLRSFLYYVPYVTLTVITFPAILDATQTPVSGALALVAEITLAWRRASLSKISASRCVVAFLAELLVRV